MTTILDLVVLCPDCHEAFVTHALGSYGNAGQDTDFRPHYWGLNPLPFMVHECPNCSFVAPDDRFDSSDASSDGLPRDPAGPGADRLARAARSMRDTEASAEEVAWLFLRAAWCARIDGDAADERMNMTEAAQSFEMALEGEEIGANNTAAATYLVGELHRRCGDFARALSWFARASALDHPNPDFDLTGLIERQRQLAQAGDAANAEMPSED